MNTRRPAILAIAILVAGLLVGGTGGAIAGGMIGTGQLENGAVTSPKIKNGTVAWADLAGSARGAKVEQYVSSGAVFDTANYTFVALPGHWSAPKIARSTWSVSLYRAGDDARLFMLGQSANAGEGAGDGFYLDLDGDENDVLVVHIGAPSFSDVTSIIINRTIATRTVGDAISSTR